MTAMKNRPIYRLTLFLLPTLLLLNLLLYLWFAGKTRETAADEVVQKSYIISRLLSEFSASSLDRGELTGLKKIIEEVFKDRHIVSVTILDSKGGVIFQSAVPRTDHRLSTFETPVKLDGKSIATLVTSFSLDESEEMISGKLRRTALLQAGMFALVAAFMAYLCRREKLSLQRPATGSYEDLILAADAELAADPEITPERFDRTMKMELIGKTDQLCRASSSLEKAANLLAAESGRQMQTISRVEESRTLIDAWHRQALQDGANAEELIASSRRIIEMVQEGEIAGETGGETEPERADAARLLQDVICGIERLVCAGGENGEVNPLLTPDETLRIAGEMVGEGVATIRQRVFPALADAVGAGEEVAGRLSSLLEQLDECGDRADQLNRRGGELQELADGIRLLRRDLPFADATDNGGEERLNLLAGRLESIAAELKAGTRELLSDANGATASARSIISTMESSKEKLLAAGSTVEDSAAASVMGSGYLQAFLRRAGAETIDDGTDSVALIEAMQELLPRLEELMAALARAEDVPEPGPEQPRAQSLALAGENLLVAGRFLEEIAASAAELAKNPVSRGELHPPSGTSANADAGELIEAANRSLGELRLQEPGEKRPAGKD